MSLQGKRVLVTGGGSGLGADLAKRFAAEGASVVIAGRSLTSLRSVEREHTAIQAIAADVTDESSVIDLFRKAGRCDIVIANAGAVVLRPFVQTGADDWDHLIGANLTGVFLTFREGVRQMPNWGRLIAISSAAGLQGYPQAAPYVAARHGVIGMVKSLAMELAGQALTVNALCPGFQEAALPDRSIETPQGRVTPPTDIAAAALWLCAPGTEGVSGQAIAISGGEI